MLNYFKRAGDKGHDVSSGAAPKRPRTAKNSSTPSGEGSGSTATSLAVGDPRTIVSWNVNGLSSRLSKDWREFHDFVVRVKPDVCCIQEARLSAAGFPGCKRNDDRGRRRGQLKEDTKNDKADKTLVEETLMKMARKLGYRVVMSLANYKYAGTAALIRDTCQPANIFYSLGPDGLSRTHHPEGRVIALEYATFTLLALYVPNNGVTEKSFCRRRDWDSNMRAFVGAYDRPIVLSGDLNVAHTDADLTHPSYFKKQCPAADPENSGQPGCTPAEKERHSQLLEVGTGLIDAYRHVHPVQDGDAGTNTPGITWRGTAGTEVAAAGRFYGKGMRIDYFLASAALASRIADVSVFGSGADRLGFMGSDHSPIMLELRGATAEDNRTGS